MARKRASMREGPLAELFRATEAARQEEAFLRPDGLDASLFRLFMPGIVTFASERPV